MTVKEAIEILSRPKSMRGAPAEILTAHAMAIEALEKEPRKGHWIKHEQNGIAHIECSECLTWFLRCHLTRNSFCPNCGAKMVEPQESEE